MKCLVSIHNLCNSTQFKFGASDQYAEFRSKKLLRMKALLEGSYLLLRRDPDFLTPPKALSPDLKFGSLSVRHFYWSILDAFNEVSHEYIFRQTDRECNKVVLIYLVARLCIITQN